MKNKNLNFEKFSLKELEELILDEHFRHKEKKVKSQILFERCTRLNREFQFTYENIKEIERINNRLIVLMHETYNKVAKIKYSLDEQIAKGNSVFATYTIEGNIHFEIGVEDKDLPVRKIIDRITLISNSAWSVIANDGEKLRDRTEVMLDYLNWNIEILSPMKQTYICYATHVFFCDENKLSLSDMINIRDEEISTFIEIRI